MPDVFSDAQIQALGEILKPLFEEHSKSIQAQLTDQLNTTVSGAFKRMKQEGIDPLTKQMGEIAEWRKSASADFGAVVKDQFTELLETLAQQAIDEEKPSGTTAPATEGVSAAAGGADLETLRKQIQEEFSKTYGKQIEGLKKQVTQAEKQAEAERLERERIAEANRVQSMRDAALSELSGQVASGRERRLLTLLEQEGVLVEDKENNAYRVKSKDRFGEDTLVPIKDVLPDLLKTQYSEYLPPRPGTGAGSTPPTSTSASPTGLQYLREDISTADLLKMAGDDKTWGAVVQEFDEAAKAS